MVLGMQLMVAGALRKRAKKAPLAVGTSGGLNSTASAANLRVLAYNVWWWNNPGSIDGVPTTDYAGLTGMHAYWRSLPRMDVVGVQECDGGWPTLRSYLNGTVDYLVEVPMDGPLCTLYDAARFSLLLSGRRDVYGYRFVEYLRLRDLATGGVIFFANTHWDHLRQNPEEHARNTARAIQDFSEPGDTVIVVGDFNQPWSIPAFEQVFRDQMGLNLVGRGTSHDQIDHIWEKLAGSAACESPDDSGPAGPGSDHNPVYCEFNWAPGSPTPTPPPAPAPPATCESQWNNPACDAGGCFPCGSRITWLVENLGMTEQAAREQVATEFPQDCGACASSGPAPTPTMAPTTPTPAPAPPTTPAPMPPPVSGTCGAADLSCGSSWPEAYYDCEARGLVGTEIVTDNAVRACSDCAVRCFLGIYPGCVGFVTDQAGNDAAGTCTYYSSITGVDFESGADSRAFITSAALDLFSAR